MAKDSLVIKINIRSLNNPDFFLEVDNTLTIRHLIEKIKLHLNDQKNRGKIIFHGRVLDNEQTIQHYSIKKDDVVHIFFSNFSKDTTTGVEVPITEENSEENSSESSDSSSDNSEYQVIHIPSLNEEDTSDSGDGAFGRFFDYQAFILGCLIGYFMGGVILLFVWDPSISTRLRVGLILGVFANIFFTVFLHDTPSTTKQ